ncbi:MAG TPA: nucleotidyltransferase family protein [Abditibacterium sp.]|jgi:hypothetical protein
MSIPAAVLARPEHRLLLLCACHVHSPAVKKTLTELVTQNLDWDYLLPRLKINGLMALFSHHLQRQEALLPPMALQSLQQEFGQSLQKRLVMLTELQQIVTAFGGAEIRVLAYKGPTLAYIAYGSVALRPFSDLDLLIAREDKARAVAVLKQLGYLPDNDKALSDAAEAKRQLRDYEMTLRPTNGLGRVDLHWAVAPPYDGFPLHFEALWERRVASQLLPDAETFCREDLILTLCAHGLKHRWMRLEWIGCLRAFLHNSTETPLDWKQIEQTAASLRCRRALYLGLQLALDLAELDAPHQTIVGQNIPLDLRRKMEADSVVKRLSQQVWQERFHPRNSHQLFISVPDLVFAIRAREGWKQRSSYFFAIWRAFLLPEAEDIHNSSGSWLRMYLKRFSQLIFRRLHRLIVQRRF